MGNRRPYPNNNYWSDFDDVIDIDANTVVWEANGDIYGADISDLANIRVFAICTDQGRQYDPAISGKLVVWTDQRSDTGDIYGADISEPNSPAVFVVAKGTGVQTQPAVSKGVIVYLDQYNGSGTLKAKFVPAGKAILDMPLTQIVKGIDPAIDNGKVVMLAEDEGSVISYQISVLVDNDFDKMDDAWELLYGLNTDANDGQADNDADRLLNIDEYKYKSDPSKGDTDNDGLGDYNEVYVHTTSPTSSDTDKDTMPDGWEVMYGLNPLTNDKLSDFDNDGLNNINEYNRNCNPSNADTDDDGMPDGWEVSNSLNPLANDANDDADRDGLTNLQEYTLKSNPLKADCDSDGMPDGWEVHNGLNCIAKDATLDADNDGLTNIQEYNYNCNPQSGDTDGDTLGDSYEVGKGLNPCENNSGKDSDGDGLDDIAEYELGCEPKDRDTDNDYMWDGFEVDEGLDPNNTADGVLDRDGDSFSNVMEWVHGSDIDDAQSKPMTTRIDVPVKVPLIQAAIDLSVSGDEIVASPGRYVERLRIAGKNVMIRGLNGDDPCTVAATIIDANNSGLAVHVRDNAVLAISGCTITKGRFFQGGGIYVLNSTATIEKCVVAGNNCTGSRGGGGIYTENSNVVVAGNIFRGNKAVKAGAIAISGGTVIVRNNLVYKNQASNDGAVSLTNSEAEIRNNTIVKNTSTNLTGCSSAVSVYGNNGKTFSIRNNIIALGTGAAAFYTPDTNIDTVVYNDFYANAGGDGATFLNSYALDPLFASADSNDFHLKSEAGRWAGREIGWVTDDQTSPCIDAGDPCDSANFETWPHGLRVNLGAYGGAIEASMSMSNVGLRSDLDLNKNVDFRDILTFVDYWAKEGVLIRCDLDHNGRVNLADYAIIAADWMKSY